MTSHPHQTLTILVVEDDRAIAELIRELLNDVSGWGATVVHDGAGARHVFRYVDVDALVVDVNLPGISGIELIRALRQAPSWNEPPVLLMSADRSQPAIQDALRNGLVTRFLSKPFEVDELIRQLDTATSSLGLGQTTSPRTSRSTSVGASDRACESR